MSTIGIVVLGMLCLGVLPIWSYGETWGYVPSGALGFLLVALTILTLMGWSDWSDRTATAKP